MRLKHAMPDYDVVCHGLNKRSDVKVKLHFRRDLGVLARTLAALVVQFWRPRPSSIPPRTGTVANCLLVRWMRAMIYIRQDCAAQLFCYSLLRCCALSCPNCESPLALTRLRRGSCAGGLEITLMILCFGARGWRS
jgi:hypothetical protein